MIGIIRVSIRKSDVMFLMILTSMYQGILKWEWQSFKRQLRFAMQLLGNGVSLRVMTREA
jgi:hypothetical protein